MYIRNNTIATVFRVVFLIVCGAGLVMKLLYSKFSIDTIMSDFALISNVLALIYFAYLIIARPGYARGMLRGAVTIYMLVTFIVYYFIHFGVNANPLMQLSLAGYLLYFAAPLIAVLDYLLYIASVKGIRPAVAKQRAKELLKQVGLTKARNKKMKTLSGGMKRRAGIAQAMLNNPKILILDEPTAGLDPSERIRFRNLISELAEDRIVLLSTHIVSDIEYIANDILLMKDGQITVSGTSEEIIATMPDKVWRCTVPKGKIDAYLKAYKVSNVKTVSNGVELRIVAKNPPAENVIQETPTLEDVFLYYFGERAGGEDDTI